MSDNRETTLAELQAIAKALEELDGQSWSATIDDYRVSGHLLLSDEPWLYVHTTGKAYERFEVRGVMPRHPKTNEWYLPYNVKVPEITAARERGAEAIAKDITSRLLPECNRVRALVQERIDGAIEAEILRESLAHYLAIVPGVEVLGKDKNYRSDDIKITMLGLEGEKVRGEAKIHYDHKLTLELRDLAHTTARAVLSALAACGKCDCCERGDEYNGYGSGATVFTCPESCTCHD